MAKPVIAVAGAGDLAKVFLEESWADGTFDVVVCTSKVRMASRHAQNKTHTDQKQMKEWYDKPNINVAITDYSVESMTELLNSTGAVALYVFYITFDYPVFVKVHSDLLDACIASKSCKRFVPSEWCGNALDFPRTPRFYGETRLPIREKLCAQTEVEWTVICLGFFMDYVVPSHQTYLKDYGEMDPWHREKWVATLMGTGDEMVGMTSSRDVMKAAIEIAKLPKWENYFFIVGENTTLNKVTKQMEEFYGRKFNKIQYKTKEYTEAEMEINKDDVERQSVLDVFEWLYNGATYMPEEYYKPQREKYFTNVKFRTVAELLADSKVKELV
ncbi:nmra-like protein [Grosmannia clavigera kw1407]|uniref:Nmra-like protein n=1 Tax=Grosmannia clavigera (strain kw1407 / UAMH 11150) TaxID=655863 RepID=F0X742_GROCL|nr:nmra-like protein [Grosmannia clavigera kw1407]EFX06571.1 nmra-like protein [Grosmannia clavigera kw1407]